MLPSIILFLFFLFTYQIPRASGQSRAMPAHVSRGDTGLSNRKWSYCKYREQKFYTQSANNGYDWNSENFDRTLLSEADRNKGVRLKNSDMWSIFLIMGKRKMPWEAQPTPIFNYMLWDCLLLFSLSVSRVKSMLFVWPSITKHKFTWRSFTTCTANNALYP